jgi:ferric-dicitrate binding protein FerR (iron transport regulator)
MTIDETVDDQIRNQASHWVIEFCVRHRDSTDAAERQRIVAGLMDWIAEDPRHRVMFEEISILWDGLRKGIKDQRRRGIED